MTLQDEMLSVIAIFDKYAGKEGNKKTLNKNELVEFAKNEFPALCQNQDKDQILKGVFGKMDRDGDNEVNFKEFVFFISTLTIALKESL